MSDDRIVVVDWIDSTSGDAWVQRDNAATVTASSCRSVGYVLRDRARARTVARRHERQRQWRARHPTARRTRRARLAHTATTTKGHATMSDATDLDDELAIITGRLNALERLVDLYVTNTVPLEQLLDDLSATVDHERHTVDTRTIGDRVTADDMRAEVERVGVDHLIAEHRAALAELDNLRRRVTELEGSVEVLRIERDQYRARLDTQKRIRRL